MWREMAEFIKSHMKIQHLSLNIGGRPLQAWFYRGMSNYLILSPKHPEIDELLVLPPVQRLSIQWTASSFPASSCRRHGAWCLDNINALRSPGRCWFAVDTVAVGSSIKFIRDRLLGREKSLGLSQIRGGLVFNKRDQRYDNVYIVMETDDGCNGASHLATQQVSHVTDTNTGMHAKTSPR